MDLLDFLFNSLLGTIVPFLFVLTVVVFFHELGHFWVARRCGVKIDAFSVGFGRELFGRNDKYGTRWKVCWIPLGGYVKFSGDENAASMPSREEIASMDEETRRTAFFAKSVWQRMAIVAAGPIANFILAIVIFAGLFFFLGKMETVPRVDAVRPDSAAQVAGFEPGDIILRINDSEIESFADLQRIVTASANQELRIDVDREGVLVHLKATPKRQELTDPFGNTQKVGVLGIEHRGRSGDVKVRSYGALEALGAGAQETWFIIARTGGYIAGLFHGTEDTSQLGGPIKIAEVSGQVAAHGIIPLVNLIAVLSVSIGLLNLLPVPVLDGGHLLFYVIEAVRGKPLNERVQDIGFRIGISLVLLLMIFTTWNDLRTKIIEWL
ncbi:RIP metalloprotease RseP [Polycladidibacter stylochi]|uniref:RIP metalloprotease RseP n=1 Tax=Polycladidibacter stylochi TaxID=1807766 RepID=UPI000835D995|nr:RIP metalloprotease RseP [Pseudovibrio stylochi]